MKLKLVKTYEEGVGLAMLQELGLFGVRKQTRLDKKVLVFIEEFDANHQETEAEV